MRSKTFDIKQWNQWNYENDRCIMCNKCTENMDHFVSCVEYGTPLETDCKHINGNNMEYQIEIGQFIQNRQKIRQKIIRQLEVGQTSKSGSTAPDLL